MYDAPALLKAEQAAKFINVSRSKFYSMMEDGTVPGVVRFGRSVRVSRLALERWIAEQAGLATDQPVADRGQAA